MSHSEFNDEDCVCLHFENGSKMVLRKARFHFHPVVDQVDAEPYRALYSVTVSCIDENDYRYNCSHQKITEYEINADDFLVLTDIDGMKVFYNVDKIFKYEVEKQSSPFKR